MIGIKDRIVKVALGTLASITKAMTSLQVIRNLPSTAQQAARKEAIDYLESKGQKLNVVLRAKTVGVLISAWYAMWSMYGN